MSFNTPHQRIENIDTNAAFNHAIDKVVAHVNMEACMARAIGTIAQETLGLTFIDIAKADATGALNVRAGQAYNYCVMNLKPAALTENLLQLKREGH